MRVFAISLILFSVSCSAATIVGEFSGVVGSFDLLSVGSQNYYSQAGLSEGDLITGSFSYESDAAVSEVERQNPLRGATYYEAHYLRLQFGDLLIENNDVVAVTASPQQGAGIPFFGILVEDPSIDHPQLNGPIEFFITDSENNIEAPLDSNELPTSEDDVNPSLLSAWSLILPLAGEDLHVAQRTLTIGPTCDGSSGGDLDGNGVVTFSDFLILSSNFGQEVDGHRLGDIDCDGAVRFSDFLILADNFGDTPNESVSVPEASSKLLMYQLFLFLLLYQRTE